MSARDAKRTEALCSIPNVLSLALLQRTLDGESVRLIAATFDRASMNLIENDVKDHRDCCEFEIWTRRFAEGSRFRQEWARDRGGAPTNDDPSIIGSWTDTGFPFNRCRMESMVRSKLAPTRSILFTKQIRGTL